MTHTIKVLIVEDSPLAAKLLAYIIDSTPQMKVIGTVSSGEEALKFIRNKTPDVITMDIVLPGMDGFETTQKILHFSQQPIPIIIVSANYDHEDIDKSFKAIVAGAVDIIEKPVGPRDPKFQAMAAVLIQSIKNADNIKQMQRFPQNAQLTSSQETPSIKELQLSGLQAIAMGASLGGPKALNAIFSKLPSNFPSPIFLVQHISAGFTLGLVNWLGENSALRIKLAEHQEFAQPGTVYVAPDQCHLEAGPNQTILLNNNPPQGGLRPSVSALFRSMAIQYGNKGMGILLTGMGRDGAEDLLAMRKSGSLTIAQDQRTCLVFGMPREAIALGAANYVLSLQQIIDLLTSMVK